MINLILRPEKESDNTVLTRIKKIGKITGRLILNNVHATGDHLTGATNSSLIIV
jgi:hypothetical protein